MKKHKLVKYLVAVCAVMFAWICFSNTNLVSAAMEIGEAGRDWPVGDTNFVDDLEMTDEEIENAYFGRWTSAGISISEISRQGYCIHVDSIEYGYDIDWVYQGVVTLKDQVVGVDPNGDLFDRNNRITRDVKVLHFTYDEDDYDEDYHIDYYFGRAYPLDYILQGPALIEVGNDGATWTVEGFVYKVSNSEMTKVDIEDPSNAGYLTRINNVLAAAKGAKGADSSKDTKKKDDKAVKSDKDKKSNEEVKSDKESKSDKVVKSDKKDKTGKKNDYSYTTKKGDTLSNIATNFYGTNLNRYKIKEYNAAAFKKTGGKLVEGMELKIPAKIGSQERLPEIVLAKGEKTYTVKEGDTLWIIAKQFYGNGEKYKELFKRNADRIVSENKIYAGQEIVVPAK